MKSGLKGGISIYADSGAPRYVLWCCSCICHELLTFFQIGCGHTVPTNIFIEYLTQNVIFHVKTKHELWGLLIQKSQHPMLPNLTLNDTSFKKMGDSSVQVRFNDGYFFSNASERGFRESEVYLSMVIDFTGQI